MIASLREVLARASYDEDGVREVVRPDSIDLVRGIAAVRLRPVGQERLGLLVRLFIAGDELDVEVAAAALAPLALADLEAAGIVARTPTGVVARVRLTPLQGLIVASDPVPRGRFAADHVIHPAAASETLAKITIRSNLAAGLDVGTGAGVQALLLARHCERVVGTDVNRRALGLAALSAALNGVENVDWVEGDLFEPVRESAFDVVVSNPPFVLGPAMELSFRDGGRARDELSRQAVSGCASVLAEGGFGHVLCSWVRGEGEHWSEAPLRWLAGRGCDAVILLVEVETAVSYAIGWASLGYHTPVEAARRAEPWLDYYRRLGISEIATGLVVMRRRSGANWIHTDEPLAIRWGAGEQLTRMFAGHDLLDALADDEALLDLRLGFAAGVRLVERRHPDGELDRARLAGEGGLSLRAPIAPPVLLPVLRALAAHGTLRAAGAAAGAQAPELRSGLPAVRDLLRRGYLVAG